ncbi:MAG: zf-HC2 domain-containing protein [Acidobacteriaceae bacterium]|nr:zf-HC2 domain-containing protein [Acidobacteriaceae bacterium]
MEKLSKFVTSRLALRQGQTTDHPDADVLAAFAEGRLSSRERTNVLGHLAQCPDCRETIALTAAGQGSEENFASPTAQRGPAWWKWRWASAVAIACLVLAVIWHSPSVQKTPERPPASETSPPIEAPKPAEPAMPEPPKIKKKKTAPAITARRSERKKEKLNTELPVVTDALREAVTMPRSAPLQALTAPEQAQNFVTRANSQLRSKRIMAGMVEGNLWRLTESTRGALQRSADGGKTWETVSVSNDSRFYALSATGTEIWVGGAEGALFHSADNGSHWTRVVVKDEEQQLGDAITRIDVEDEKTVRLKTQPGDTWITLDGGLHWRPG